MEETKQRQIHNFRRIDEQCVLEINSDTPQLSYYFIYRLLRSCWTHFTTFSMVNLIQINFVVHMPI